MGQDEKYSLISVNTDDDEEIVIQTGVSRQAAAEMPDPVDEDESGEGVFEEADEADEDAFADGDEGEIELSKLENDPEASEPEPPRSAEPRYRETTQEDLDSVEPMSKLQKAVIAGVILIPVAFFAINTFLR